MDHELERAVSRALGVARACWELAGEAIHDDHFTQALADAIAKSAGAGAADIQIAVDRLKGNLIADLHQLLSHASIDLQTIEGLAGLATTFKLTAKNGLHVAQAVVYTSQKVVDGLNSAQRRFGPSS
jgi:hypothetical protein